MAAAEAPGLGVRVRPVVEAGHGDPALVAQVARLALGAVGRQKQARRRGRVRQGAQDTVRIEREPGRGFAAVFASAAGAVGTAVVAAATAQLAAHAAGEQDEADAGLVLEAAVLDRIDGQRQVGRGLADQGDDPLQAVHLRRRGLGQRKPAQRGQRSVGRTGRAQQGMQGFGIGPGDLVHDGRVLAVERLAHRGDARLVQAQVGGDQADQRRQVQVDRQVRHPDRGERLGGGGDHLGVGALVRGADQLGTDLAELPLGAELAALHLEHLTGVAQAQRPRRVAQARRRDA